MCIHINGNIIGFIRKVLVKPSMSIFLVIHLSGCTYTNNLFYFENYEQFLQDRSNGFQLYQQQEYTAALKQYEIVLLNLPSNGQESLKADIYYKIGRTNLKQQNYIQAIDAFEQALTVQKNSSDQDRAILLNMLGLSYQKVSNIEKAKNNLLQALDLRIRNKDPLGEAKTIANLAAIYLSQAQYLKAIEHYKKAQHIFLKRAGAGSKEVGKILTSLSSVYAEMGQYDKALAIQKQGLEIFEKIGNKEEIASSYHNLGYIKSKQLDYKSAVNSFKQAIALRQQIQDRFGVAETRNNLGMILSKMGKNKQALTILTKAVQVLQALNTRKQIAATYDSIGSVYTQTNEYSLALDAYQKAVLIWKEIGERDGLRITLGNMAGLLTKTDQKVLAIVFYKQAINITENIRQDLHVLPLKEQKSYLSRVSIFYRNLADLLLQQNRVIEAQQILDLLKIQEVASFLGPVRGNENTAKGIIILASEKKIEENYQRLVFETIRERKELTELRKILPNDRSDKQKKQYKLLVDNQTNLKNAFQIFIDSDEVIEWVDQLSRSVRRQMPDLDKLESLRDNLQRLGKHVVLLYPLVLEDRLEIILATGVSNPIHIAVPVSRIALNQTVLNFRRAIINRQDSIFKHAKKLYDWLISPVEQYLQEVGAETIMYAPDGVLRYVPLSALYDGQKWMVQRFKTNNITSYSTADLETKPVDKPKLLAAAFTNGNFNFSIGDQAFNFKGLPFAGKEVNSLIRFYPKMVRLVNQQFNPETVIPELYSFNIIHFATHASLVSNKPHESFILFGNGERVTVEKIKREWMLTNVDLIVLSACETALGSIDDSKGEEILGLGYLMEKAGARATLASLWSVDDGGTQQLMSEFYRNLKQLKTTKVDALQKAQISMLEGTYHTTFSGGRGVAPADDRDKLAQKISFSHPYYWAPFILIGNGL